MKILDKISLTIFAVIILVLSLITCIVLSGWLNVDILEDIINTVMGNMVASKITITISVILAILALKCIFYGENIKENKTEGILLANENGKLLVSKDTIESLTTSVIKNYESIENSAIRVEVDNENKINIFITLSVYTEAVIKDLVSKLQIQVKEEIKRALDLEIKEVNVRIKSINVKKENTVNE